MWPGNSTVTAATVLDRDKERQVTFRPPIHGLRCTFTLHNASDTGFVTVTARPAIPEARRGRFAAAAARLYFGGADDAA
jgi:hypothetical protein